MTSKQIISLVVILVVLISIFIIVFLLNRKTPKPKGCEKLDAECDACKVTTCERNILGKENIRDE